MKFLVLIIIALSVFGDDIPPCMCSSDIDSAFTKMGDFEIKNNLDPLNQNLQQYIQALEANTKSVNDQTVIYQTILQHEAAISVLLNKKLFLMKKMADQLANNNNIDALQTQVQLKLNEVEIVKEAQILQKRKAI